MKLRLFQIDAFATQVFRGNPAAVCPLERWLAEDVMQAIAAENNLSETAFIVPGGEADYAIRWFTPMVEVELCGHATLASAYVIFEVLEPHRQAVRFASRSGLLPVSRVGDDLWMDFPTHEPRPVSPPEALLRGLGLTPQQTWRSRNYLAVYETEEQVHALRPDFGRLAELDTAVIATAPGRTVDFVSRFFAPTAGILEDPVTGSAHCTLTPYWAERLGKTTLEARQVSRRGGDVRCELRGDRVAIGGRAVKYLEGTIEV